MGRAWPSRNTPRPTSVSAPLFGRCRSNHIGVGMSSPKNVGNAGARLLGRGSVALPQACYPTEVDCSRSSVASAPTENRRKNWTTCVPPYDFPYRTVSDVKGDFGRNRKFFLPGTSMYLTILTPYWRGSPQNFVWRCGSKSYSDDSSRRGKHFDDKCIRLDTYHSMTTNRQMLYQYRSLHASACWRALKMSCHSSQINDIYVINKCIYLQTIIFICTLKYVAFTKLKTFRSVPLYGVAAFLQTHQHWTLEIKCLHFFVDPNSCSDLSATSPGVTGHPK